MSNNSPLIVVQESLACSEIVEKSKSRKKNIIKCTYSGCDLTFSRQWKRDRHYYTHTGEVSGLYSTQKCRYLPTYLL